MTTHFTLEIQLGNAAMQTDGDISSALDGVAVTLLEGDDGAPSNPLDVPAIIFDANGARVGEWKVVERGPHRDLDQLAEALYERQVSHLIFAEVFTEPELRNLAELCVITPEGGGRSYDDEVFDALARWEAKRG